MGSDNLEDLEARRDALEVAIAEIKTQLADARAVARETGEYADPKWYNAAEHSLRQKGIEFNRICRNLKKMRAAQSSSDQDWERAFVRMARQTLTEETYERLVALAWEEIGGRP